MRTIFLALCLYYSVDAISQPVVVPFGPYSDPAGLILREFEKQEVRKFERKVHSTQLDMGSLAVPSNFIDWSRSSLGMPIKRINFIEYIGVCNSYVNPFKKRKCHRMVTYLQRANTTVLDVLKTQTTYRVNNGIKKQIQQKYTSIHNMIIRELELIKQESEKDNLFAKFIIKQ